MLVKTHAMTPPLSTVATERDLRLDLFRGLALWLIFLDHIPENIMNWITIRNYGFSDATEIFIFISGYTAAFVYGRAMRERGFVISSARMLRRAWQIYVAHIFLFTIFMAEIAYVAATFDNPLYAEEMNILDFLKQPDVTIFQALLLKFKPVNMDVLPLYIVLLLLFPPMLWLLLWQPAFALAGSALLYVLAWNFDWNLPAYPNGVWFFNPFAWQLLFVFGAWCALGGAQRLSGVLRSPIVLGDCDRLSGVCLRHHHDLVRRTARAFRAGLAERLDVSDRQDQSRRAAVCAFPRARRRHRALRAARLAGSEIAHIAARYPLRPAFAGDFLPRRVFGVCRPIHHQRMVGRPAGPGGDQPYRHPDHDCDSRPDIVVQGNRRTKSQLASQTTGRRPRGRRGMKLIVAAIALLVLTDGAVVAEPQRPVRRAASLHRH